MNNDMTKILALDKRARILFAEHTDLIRELCFSPHTNQLLKTMLARTVSCTSLLTGLLKDSQRISLKISASNRNYSIYADGDAQGNVRGFMSDELLSVPDEEANACTIEQMIGDRGCIRVIHDIGMNSLTTGITDMPYSNIVDDVSHYYAQSEQTPTWISAYLVFDAHNQIELSRAVLVQLLPGAPNTLLSHAKRKINEYRSAFLDTTSTAAMRELPFTIFEDAALLETRPLQLFCGCSKEMFTSMLYALEKEELSHACVSGNPIEFVCNVCGNKYKFYPEELKAFL